MLTDTAIFRLGWSWSAIPQLTLRLHSAPEPGGNLQALLGECVSLDSSRQSAARGDSGVSASSSASGSPAVQGPLSDDLLFSVPGLQVLPAAARETFDAAVQSYATQLFDEASRNETQYRSATSAVPQYTSIHISDAERVVRSRGAATRNRSKWWIVIRLLQYVAAFFVGQELSAAAAGQGWGHWVAFGVLLTAGISLTLLSEIVDYLERKR